MPKKKKQTTKRSYCTLCSNRPMRGLVQKLGCDKVWLCTRCQADEAGGIQRRATRAMKRLINHDNSFVLTSEEKETYTALVKVRWRKQCHDLQKQPLDPGCRENILTLNEVATINDFFPAQTPEPVKITVQVKTERSMVVVKDEADCVCMACANCGHENQDNITCEDQCCHRELANFYLQPSDDFIETKNQP